MHLEDALDSERIYAAIMARAQERELRGNEGRRGYVERHYILPRCRGGGNSRANLVELTPREHFLAHLLLARMFPGDRGLARSACAAAPHHAKAEAE